MDYDKEDANKVTPKSAPKADEPKTKPAAEPEKPVEAPMAVCPECGTQNFKAFSNGRHCERCGLVWGGPK